MKLYRWQILNHWCCLLNSAFNAVYWIVFYIKLYSGEYSPWMTFLLWANSLIPKWLNRLIVSNWKKKKHGCRSIPDLPRTFIVRSQFDQVLARKGVKTLLFGLKSLTSLMHTCVLVCYVKQLLTFGFEQLSPRLKSCACLTEPPDPNLLPIWQTCRFLYSLAWFPLLLV